MIPVIIYDKPNQSIFYKINIGIKLSQDELSITYKIINPVLAYKLAKLQKNINIEKCQEVACKEPQYAYYAYLFAKDIPGANIKVCQEACLKSSAWAYHFALNIKGADIKRCEEAACKKPIWAYYFARDIKEANIKKCQEAARPLEI